MNITVKNLYRRQRNAPRARRNVRLEYVVVYDPVTGKSWGGNAIPGYTIEEIDDETWNASFPLREDQLAFRVFLHQHPFDDPYFQILKEGLNDLSKQFLECTCEHKFETSGDMVFEFQTFFNKW